VTAPLDVVETADGFRFEGEAAAMLQDLAALLGVTPLAAVRLAVRERLTELRDVKTQGRDDA